MQVGHDQSWEECWEAEGTLMCWRAYFPGSDLHSHPATHIWQKDLSLRSLPRNLRVRLKHFPPKKIYFHMQLGWKVCETHPKQRCFTSFEVTVLFFPLVYLKSCMLSMKRRELPSQAMALNTLIPPGVLVTEAERRSCCSVLSHKQAKHLSYFCCLWNIKTKTVVIFVDICYTSVEQLACKDINRKFHSGDKQLSLQAFSQIMGPRIFFMRLLLNSQHSYMSQRKCI